jgi:hypothetical protein
MRRIYPTGLPTIRRLTDYALFCLQATIYTYPLYKAFDVNLIG